ncbi:tryptophan 7-halogenase [Parvularcula sp. ZS-1/3]|uniref:Tryptophan 7-halogenase n=1 Tax=Parvularcula mediterranea TaxID=2732508 RepID=A0A7Y3W4P4_9PROT|nr:tryptophan halogenase family protein [Parvularcula mediterranea]NNU15965.1 tryptophan 7-halogenase [Parvularcula mediterranea]
MARQPIERVLIVGGGTAGWITAAAMSKLLPKSIKIELIESDAIRTVGVGEATIPQIRRLNMMLGLDEMEFVRETKGTFKLGIEFNNWGGKGESYIHTFGDVGMPLASLPFQHYWLRAKEAGQADDLWQYSLHRRACDAGRFAPLERVGRTPMGGLSYAFHFDAGLYARYLRKFAEAHGVTRTEGLIEDVALDSETGFIRSVSLKSGEVREADLFIDCSGFRGLLIGGALGVDYVDWSKWLPCNRAVAVPCERTDPLLPYTKATAHDAGWQWRIPLQHRTGNGHVFCDGFTTEEAATETLLAHLDAPTTADPRPLRFTTGRRKDFWHKNCVSVGLSSGFLEPLESTSIHLIQSNVSRLLELFPDKSFNPATIREYNRVVGKEYELIRDFLVLHYHQTEREDTEFWRYCKNMDVPDSLREKMALFEESGTIYREADDLFRDSSWIQVMVGQGVAPTAYHPMADRLSDDQLKDFLGNVDRIIDQAVAKLPTHAEFIDQTCAAGA